MKIKVIVGDRELLKDSGCQFVRKCKLLRDCEGCRNPVEARKYDDLYDLKTQYSADLEAEDGEYIRKQMGWPKVIEKRVRYA